MDQSGVCSVTDSRTRAYGSKNSTVHRCITVCNYGKSNRITAQATRTSPAAACIAPLSLARPTQQADGGGWPDTHGLPPGNAVLPMNVGNPEVFSGDDATPKTTPGMPTFTGSTALPRGRSRVSSQLALSTCCVECARDIGAIPAAAGEVRSRLPRNAAVVCTNLLPLVFG